MKKKSGLRKVIKTLLKKDCRACNAIRRLTCWWFFEGHKMRWKGNIVHKHDGVQSRIGSFLVCCRCGLVSTQSIPTLKSWRLIYLSNKDARKLLLKMAEQWHGQKIESDTD